MSETPSNFSDLTHQESLITTFDKIRQLISEENLKDAKQELIKIHSADLADLIDNSSNDIISAVFSILQSDLEPELLNLICPRARHILFEVISIPDIASLIAKLDSEDAIEFFTDIEESLKTELLELLPEEKRLHILEGFNYPEGTVGRVMAKKFVVLSEDWTTTKALDFLKKGDIPENFHAAVVIDNKYKPVGTIAISVILKEANSNTKIKTIMNNDIRVAETNTALDDLSYNFKHYALTVVPVVNKVGKVVGTVSIDNMVYIMEEQAEDAILHLGGVYEVDIYETFLQTAKQRFPWLFINLITACLTAIVINYFGPTIAKIVALASLMPIVASMGGNAGTQTMTVTIMAIANKDVTKINNIRIVLKELLSCGINGIAFAILGAIIVVSLFGDITLAKVFAVAVVINFILGGILGSAIPLILNRMKMDPAPSSGVIVNALTDSCGFLIFLGLAKIILIG